MNSILISHLLTLVIIYLFLNVVTQMCAGSNLLFCVNQDKTKSSSLLLAMNLKPILQKKPTEIEEQLINSFSSLSNRYGIILRNAVLLFVSAITYYDANFNYAETSGIVVLISHSSNCSQILSINKHLYFWAVCKNRNNY